MNDLYQKTCTPCKSGAPVMTPAEIADQLTRIPDWELIESGGVNTLQRVFKFKNFQQALAFTNRVGETAEAENHHPAILTEWGKVCITYWTHTVKGLHINDFIMAAKTDRLI